MATKKKSIDFSIDAPKDLKDHAFYGFRLDAEQQAFVDAIWDDKKPIVFCNAKAGTGKTQLSIGAANMLYGYGRYDGIVCVSFPCSENKQGYLPGTITQKSDVYFEPIYQAMIKCGISPIQAVNDSTMTSQKNGESFITLLTSTYLRGTNFENKVVIIDECQNGTLEDIKKVLTRCSDACKVIVVGHTGQIDLEDKEKSGFARYIEHFSKDNRSAICKLTTNYRGWISAYADELE